MTEMHRKLFSIARSAAALLLACSAIVYSVGAVAQEAYTVQSVVIEGNRRIDVNAVRAQIKGASGTVSSEQVAEDIRTLYNTGFFDQVTVSVVRDAGGGQRLRYLLTEKPVVRKVLIKGNKEISESELAEILKLDAKRFVDRGKIQGLLRKGVSFYQAQGFYDASLEYTTASVGENEVDLTFTVVEGERYRVREVIVKGAKGLDTDEMLSTLQTRRYKWWSSWILGTGRVNPEMLEGDRQLLRQYLLDHGYVEGQVSEGSIEKRDDGLYVLFDVTEGDQFKVGEVRVGGDLIEGSQAKTLAGVESQSGEVFSASNVRNDIFAITDKFSDQGYAFANVVPNTSLRKADGLVDLDFTINKGSLVTVNKITVSGNEKTYDNVIRRSLTIEEQQLYSGSKIKRSQTLLQRLGYFDEVNITNKPTSDPKVVDLDVHVKEATTGSFSAGAGYSTANGAIFNTRVSENNLFGTGRRANVNLDFGSQISNQIVSFDDPRVNDSNLSAGVDLMRTTRRFTDFNRELAGGSATVGYPLETFLGEWAQDISANLKYEAVYVNIKDIGPDASQFVIDSGGTSTASSLTPSLVRNTINNPLNPTKGSRQNLSVEFAGLGGDQEFYLVEARNSWFYPMVETSFGEFVLSNRTSFGYGQSLNDDPFPLFRRYFPGGINSVRGFRNRTLGPTDINGREYGGSKQLVNNLEMIFPLINSAGFKGVVFYDAGQGFDDDQAIDVGLLRQAWGYGIRWASPMGPIRVEFGYPIDKQDGERGVQTMFSFGAPI
jgi:outer membrane protein insertion porin family